MIVTGTAPRAAAARRAATGPASPRVAGYRPRDSSSSVRMVARVAAACCASSADGAVRRAAEQRLHEPQVDQQGENLLLGSVVDVALQPLALGVLPRRRARDGSGAGRAERCSSSASRCWSSARRPATRRIRPACAATPSKSRRSTGLRSWPGRVTTVSGRRSSPRSITSSECRCSAAGGRTGRTRGRRLGPARRPARAGHGRPATPPPDRACVPSAQGRGDPSGQLLDGVSTADRVGEVRRARPAGPRSSLRPVSRASRR